MNFTRSQVVFACALSGLIAAAAPALAQEAQGRAWIQVTDVNIYDTNLGPASDGVFRFYNNDRQLRGLTTVDEDSYANYTGNQFRQTVNYSVLPGLPVTSDSLVTATGSAYGIVNGTYTEAGAEVHAQDRYFEGYGGVSTTATGGPTPGFWNLILGAHTGVIIDASSFAEVYLHDRCLVDCGEANAVAALFAQFGPESAVDPGIPDLDQLITVQEANFVSLSAADITGLGGLLHVAVNQDLHLVFENLSDHEVIGRIRWDTDVFGVSAIPEPETFALTLAGLAGVAMVVRRRRSR